MKSLPCFSSPLLLLYLSLLSIMPAFTVTRNGPELDYVNCRDTVFKCGKLYAGYPFYGGDRGMGCGHPGLELRCEANFTTIDILGVKYQVLEIRYDRHILRIQREDFMNGGFCNPQTPIQNSMIDHELFDVGPGITNLTLYYDCSPSISSTLRQIPRNSYSNYKNVTVTTQNVPPHGCVANLTFLVLQTSLVRFLTNPSVNVAMEEGLKGLEVKWKDWEQACSKCTASGGACGFDHLNQTICICQNSSPNMHECHRPGSKSIFKSKRNLVFIGLAVAAIVLVSTICCVVLWLKVKSLSDHLHQEKMKENARIEAFITKFSSFSPNRYSYGEIKKMTNIFSDKLGQGGYGSVYKGKLPEGRLVAVKVLNESKGNGEDFMNEVASISRTSHVNIVTLLGFCFAKSKRPLVYEFMPHGSLDRFIYGQGLRRRSRQLELKTLYDIALGIARGLEYLHQGCNTRILHFDIKPHNILLDENFIPKISDFGLSKSCERKESIISMACARGTIGYIAPEVFCRNFGGVSYKSDVYSYGMMVFEIIGVRKNMDVGVSEKSEEYFPSWIYKHLDKSINLNLDGGIVEEEEEEEEMTRKLLIVSLWCIQFHPSDRPSMTKVLEMLQGSLQSLIIPPKPFVSSPVRLPGIHIETSSSSMI